jgi:hypothetical protein
VPTKPQTFGYGPSYQALENGPWLLSVQRTNLGGYALTLEYRSTDPLAAPVSVAQDVVDNAADAAPSIRELHKQFVGVPIDAGAASSELRQRVEAAKGNKAEIDAATKDFNAKVSGTPAFPFKDEEVMAVLDHLFGDSPEAVASRTLEAQ